MGTYALATVTQTSPLKVRRDQELAEIYINLNFIGTVSVGDRVEIRYTGTNVDITSRLTNWGSYVPWTIDGRRITVGPVGDGEPSVHLKRDRPNYSAAANMYLAASADSTELAFALRDNEVTQATVRIDRDNIWHQDQVGGKGTRYVAFREELAPNAVLMPAGSNFNSYTTPGTYYNPVTAEVSAMSNKPPSGQAGALVVLTAAGTVQLWYEYNIGGQGLTWRRRFYSGAWSDWWVESDPEWGRWKVYGPAMSHTGYNGGATLAGRYTTFRDTMMGTITVTVTHPQYMGTGQWLISLPQAARAYSLVTGVGHYYIGSAAWVVSVMGAGTGIIGVLAAGAGRISSTVPAAVGNTSVLTINFQAEL